MNQGRPSRGIKPRTKQTYSNREHARADSRVPYGDKTINLKHFKVNLLRPEYMGTEMVFRPWNALDPLEPEKKLERGRVVAEEYGQGQWVVKAMAASKIGIFATDGSTSNSTFLLYPPNTVKEDKNKNPYSILYYACKRAYDQGEFGKNKIWDSRWNKLMKGLKGQSAAMPPPKPLWFVQGQVYVNGDKAYIDNRREFPLGADPADDLTIIQLPGSAGDALMHMLDRRKPEFNGDPEEDPAGPYVYGDPCGIYNEDDFTVNGGVFVTVFNPKKVGKRFKDNKHTSWDGKIADVQGYEVVLSKRYVLDKVQYTPGLSTENTQEVFKKSQFWLDDPDNPSSPGLLYFPTQEEQLHWIARGFATVPKMIKFAWADHPEFFTAEVRKTLSAAVSVPVNGSKRRRDDDDIEDDEEDLDDELEDDEFEDDEFEDDDRPARKAKSKDTTVAAYRGGKKAKSRGYQDRDEYLEDEDIEVDVYDDDVGDDDEFEEAPPRQSSLKKKAVRLARRRGDDDDDGELEDAPPRKASKKTVATRRPRDDDFDDNEDDELDDEDEEEADEFEDEPPRKANKKGGTKPALKYEEDEFEEEAPVKASKAKKRKAEPVEEEDEFEDDTEGEAALPADEESVDDEFEEEVVAPTRKKKDVAKAKAPPKDDDEFDSPKKQLAEEELTESAEFDPEEDTKKKRKQMQQAMDTATGRAANRKTPEVPPPAVKKKKAK